jgi:hypothetical protein
VQPYARRGRAQRSAWRNPSRPSVVRYRLPVTDDDQRREPRYTCQLPALLRRGKRSLDVRTENVSFSGLFLRMAAPPAVRELVEIEILLPDDSNVRLHGMVVHAIRRGRDAEGIPGIGVELRAPSGDARAAWERFVRNVQARAADSDKRGSVGRAARDAPNVSFREEEVSEQTMDLWEDEEPTHVKPPPNPRRH